MADASEELPPLVQDLIARYDPALSQPQFDKMSRGQQDAVRDINKSLERLAKSAAMRQARLLAEELRRQNEVIRKSYQQREQLALGAGKREGEIVKATSREVVVARKRASAQELEVQRKGSTALVANQRKGMAKWEETARRHYFRMKGQYRDAQQDEEQSSQRHRTRMGDHERTFWKFVYAEYDDFLKRRRSRQRAAEFQELADSKIAGRRAWEQQRSQNSRDLTILREHQRRVTNSHKAMWSIIRSATETGGRFMSSITQSALRSMGSAVGIGLSRITGVYKREGGQQEAALRSTYADQEAITRRALVRQQGIVQGFQTRNSAVAQGGKGGGPIGAIMSVRNMLLGAGAFISARAIFGPIMDYQQTKIAFEGILQSGTAAEAMLTQLQNFAKVTPFTFAGIADSAKQLLAVGYAADDVIPMMTTLGNTAAGLGLGEDAISGVIRALGQMKGKGKASAEELQQISEQLPGFSAIEAIASSMGITVAEAFDQMKAGAIPADAAIEAILAGMERMPGAAGAMERQSQSLSGRLSTLKDTIQILMIRAIDPFIDSISDAIGMFTTFLDNLFNAGGVFKVVRSALMGIAIALGVMLSYQGVVLMLDGIRLALAGIAANPATAVFVALVTSMVLLYRHVPAVTEVVNDMRDAFMEFFDGTREALSLLMDGDFPAFFEQMQSLGSDLTAALAPSANVIRDFFVDAFDRASQWVQGGGMGDLWDTSTETISSTAEQLADSPAAEWLVDFGKASWQRWQEWLDSGGAGDLAESIGSAFSDALGRVGDVLGSIDWQKIMGPALGVGAVGLVAAIFGGPAALGVALAGGVLAASPRLREGITGLLSQVGEWISGAFAGVDWAAVGMAALEGLRAAGEFLGGPVVSAIFSETGIKIMGGITAGVLAALGAFTLGLVQGLSDSIPQAFRNIRGVLVDEIGGALSDSVKDSPLGPIVDSLLVVLGAAFDAVASELDLFGAIIDAVTGRGDWGDVTDKLGAAFVDWWTLALSAPQVVRGLSDSLNQIVTAALAGASTALTDWARNLDGPLGGLVRAFAANFALVLGVVSDVLDRARDFVRGWIDVIVGLFTGDFGRVVEGVRGVWGAVLGLMFDLIGRLFTFLWDKFTGMGSFIWGAAEAGLNWVKERIFGWAMTVVNFWSSLPQTMADAFLGFGGLVIDAIKAGFNAAGGFAQDIVNGIIDLINAEVIDRISGYQIDLPGPGPKFDIPDLPRIPHVELAKGGIVTKPTVALIGEAGPEAVVPLSDGMGKIPLSVMFDTSAIAGQVAGVAALLAPMGERISEATMPGLRSWSAEVGQLLDNMSTDFKDWGKAMVVTATIIGTSIASAMTSALREGRREVVRIVRGYGRSLASALNPLLEAIGEQPVTMEFAKGGIVEAREGAQVHVFNEGRRGRGSSHGEAYIPFDPANKPRSQALAAETVRRLGGDVQWYAKGGLSPEAIRRGQSFARAQDGKPYVWGGVGPNGYDCSGLASAIVNAVRGEDPYRRLFTSGSLVAGASAGLLPGLGQVSVGARSGSPGHVSSTIAGLNAESTGDHVRIGAAARSAADFPSRWHLGSGVYIGPNGTVYPLPEIPEVGRGELGRLGSGWMRYVKDRAQRFVDENTYTGTAFGGPESGVPSGMMVGDGSPEVFAAIRRAMGIVGVPSSWLGPLLTLIGRESSFNPRAYNRILGASGLMQTIPSTFAAYHLDPWNNIFGPTDNVIAGLRYIIGRYGSIFNVGQAMSPTPTRGYSYGGVVDREGLYRLAEGNRREMVLPLENPSRTSALLRRLGVDTGPTDEMVRPARANVEMGSVIGVMNVNTNAADPETVATITTNKIDQRVRQIMAGV